MKVVFVNKKEPANKPIKPLSEILIEKWTRRDKQRAEKLYGNKKAK